MPARSDALGRRGRRRVGAARSPCAGAPLGHGPRHHARCRPLLRGAARRASLSSPEVRRHRRAPRVGRDGGGGPPADRHLRPWLATPRPHRRRSHAGATPRRRHPRVREHPRGRAPGSRVGARSRRTPRRCAWRDAAGLAVRPLRRRVGPRVRPHRRGHRRVQGRAPRGLLHRRRGESGLPTRSARAFLKGCYHLEGKAAEPALFASYVAAGIATTVGAVAVIAALLVALFV